MPDKEYISVLEQHLLRLDSTNRTYAAIEDLKEDHGKRFDRLEKAFGERTQKLEDKYDKLVRLIGIATGAGIVVGWFVGHYLK